MKRNEVSGSERRMGDELAALDLKSGRPTKESSHDGSITQATLKDLGINFNQSSRWQAIAGV